MYVCVYIRINVLIHAYIHTYITYNTKKICKNLHILMCIRTFTDECTQIGGDTGAQGGGNQGNSRQRSRCFFPKSSRYPFFS